MNLHPSGVALEDRGEGDGLRHPVDDQHARDPADQPQVVAGRRLDGHRDLAQPRFEGFHGLAQLDRQADPIVVTSGRERREIGNAVVDDRPLEVGEPGRRERVPGVQEPLELPAYRVAKTFTVEAAKGPATDLLP